MLLIFFQIERLFIVQLFMHQNFSALNVFRVEYATKIYYRIW